MGGEGAAERSVVWEVVCYVWGYNVGRGAGSHDESYEMVLLCGSGQYSHHVFCVDFGFSHS